MAEELVIKQNIEAPASKIWKALTDREEMSHWYFDIEDFELEKGKTYSFTAGSEEMQYLHEGKILKIEPEKVFSYTWRYPEHSDAETVVTWSLEPTESGTMVTLKHEGIEKFENLGKDFSRDNFTMGWTAFLTDRLKNFVENNKSYKVER